MYITFIFENGNIGQKRVNLTKSYQILQIHTKTYLCELLIINITLYSDLLLQLHVKV